MSVRITPTKEDKFLTGSLIHVSEGSTKLSLKGRCQTRWNCLLQKKLKTTYFPRLKCSAPAVNCVPALLHACSVRSLFLYLPPRYPSWLDCKWLARFEPYSQQRWAINYYRTCAHHNVLLSQLTLTTTWQSVEWLHWLLCRAHFCSWCWGARLYVSPREA